MHIYQLKGMNVCMHYLFAYNHDENLLGKHYVYTCLYSMPRDMRANMNAFDVFVCLRVHTK